jgi:hypothetical protein
MKTASQTPEQKIDQQVAKAALQVARSMIANPHHRTHTVNGQQYTIDLEMNEDNTAVVVTTWGYDMEEWPVPQTWGELVNSKMRASFGWMHPADVAFRFYYETMKKFN